MFDGLKDKLSSFRDDAAEEVEEQAEAAEAEAEAEAETEAQAEAAAETEAEAAAEAGTGQTADTESPATAEAGEPADAGRADAGGPDEAADDEDGGPGRLKRAAAFATGRVIIEEGDLEDQLWDLEMALLDSDVEMSVAEEMLESIRESLIGEMRAQVDTTEELVTEALRDALLDVIAVGQFDFERRVREADKPVTIVFTGINGVGKTTTIAKLSQYFEERGLSTVMANGDTYRAGANEQISQHAEALDTEIITHEQGGDPAAVVYDAVEYADANGIDVVLGDTAGRLHTSEDLMEQLSKIDRVVEPDMTLFVDEAVAGQDAVERAREFDDAAAIDGAVLTKADADSSGGAAISVAYVTGKPVLFLGVGQGYDDIERSEPAALVDSLLGEE